MRPLIGVAALLLLAAGACTASEETTRAAAAECEAGAFTVVDEEALGQHTFTASFPCPESEERLATVIVLHGWPGSGWGMRGTSNMDVLAEEHGFMAVYPSDPESNWDTKADGFDAGFLSDLIDTLIAGWSADPERIYLAGMSNGGDMTLAAGAGLTDKLAAIAPVVPANTRSTTASVNALESPLPMVAFVGETDTRFIDGSLNVLNTWFERGGCSSDGVTTEADGYVAESWTCSGGVPALLYTVDGGHQWFGSPDHDYPLWASQVMWDFFSGLEG